MTPLDDELRSMFRDRAGMVAPAPDPLGGIERRAKRMRRNRVGASVAGAALAVAAIAVAVPSLVPDHEGAVQQPAHPSNIAEPSPGASGSYGPNELDPASPWAYRGAMTVIAGNELVTLRSEWAATHPGATLTPLYGEIYGPSQQPQITFVSTGGGEDRWGVATTSEGGWVWLHDEALAPHSTTLMAVLPADGPSRLLIVTTPMTGQIQYAKDGNTFASLPTVGDNVPGVAYTALEGDTSHDIVRVLDGDGDLDHPVFAGPAPDAIHSSGPMQTFKPANYLEWQTRGTVDARTESQAVSAFAQAKGTTDDKVGHHVLWGGTDNSGRNLVFMEAWVHGQQAQTFGFVSTGEPFLGPVIGKSPDVLAYLASGAPGTGTDVLVLLPRLGAGPFSYAVSATAPYHQVGNARSDLENVAVIYRDPKATSDRLKVVDGDGMKVLYDGAVQPLLCGASSCG
jgi:hypothetical protein